MLYHGTKAHLRRVRLRAAERWAERPVDARAEHQLGCRESAVPAATVRSGPLAEGYSAVPLNAGHSDPTPARTETPTLGSDFPIAGATHSAPPLASADVPGRTAERESA